MGNRDEVCVIYDPGEQPAEEFAEQLRTHLETDLDQLSVDISEPDRTNLDNLSVAVGSEVDADAAVDDHVYVFGVTWTYSEMEGWRTVLRAFPTQCDWFLDIYTQEAGYMGQGHLYHRIGSEHVKVDEYHTTEGGYADELIDYFAVEHDIRPLTYSLMQLE